MPDAYWRTIAFLFGAVVGSFLNVVIWRLPRGFNLSHPPSHCPRCNHKIRPWENIPILSFLLLRARCSGCGERISWRYPGVELLTALLFLALVWHFGATLEAAAYCLFTAALLAAFFIDLELFLIPDELNNFAMFVGLGLDAVHVAQQGPPALVWGWMPKSVLGAMVCAAAFVFIQLLGFVLFRKTAMGDGDVKLARAIGALLPLRQALFSFFLAVAVGAVVGVAAMLASRNHPAEQEEPEPADNEIADEDAGESPEGIGMILRYGLAYVVFVIDLGFQFVDYVDRLKTGRKKVALTEEEDDFVATPSHIPFGPFMVAGCLLSVFVGDRLIDAYLKWVGLGR